MPDSPWTTASLCRSCASKRDVVTGKGSTFLLCSRALTDPRFAKYPMQPVRHCAGFEPRRDEGGEGDRGSAGAVD